MTAQATMDRSGSVAFVRTAPAPALAPPALSVGWLGWLRANLFSTPFNAVLTVLTVLFLVWTVPPVVRFLLIDAVWSGADREACLVSAQHPHVGACWPSCATGSPTSLTAPIRFPSAGGSMCSSP